MKSVASSSYAPGRYDIEVEKPASSVTVASDALTAYAPIPGGGHRLLDARRRLLAQLDGRVGMVDGDHHDALRSRQMALRAHHQRRLGVAVRRRGTDEISPE